MIRVTGTLMGFALLVGAVGQAKASIVLGGTDGTYVAQGLQDLGLTYSDQRAPNQVTVSPSGLGAGDTIILANDGGTNSFYDYTSFLNAGGHLIVTGGSNYDPYRAWASNYFNITDTGIGWHTDGGWTTVASVPADQYLPTTYTFQNSAATFHMLGFAPTADTTLFGKNGEGDYVGAIRNYSNGGTFTYMALDIGQYSGGAQDQAFVDNFLKGALNPGGNSAVPEPSSLALFGMALSGLGIARWRKRK